jgi:hypothetical protein
MVYIGVDLHRKKSQLAAIDPLAHEGDERYGANGTKRPYGP